MLHINLRQLYFSVLSFFFSSLYLLFSSFTSVPQLLFFYFSHFLSLSHLNLLDAIECKYRSNANSSFLPLTTVWTTCVTQNEREIKVNALHTVLSTNAIVYDGQHPNIKKWSIRTLNSIKWMFCIDGEKWAFIFMCTLQHNIQFDSTGSVTPSLLSIRNPNAQQLCDVARALVHIHSMSITPMILYLSHSLSPVCSVLEKEYPQTVTHVDKQVEKARAMGTCAHHFHQYATILSLYRFVVCMWYIFFFHSFIQINTIF